MANQVLNDDLRRFGRMLHYGGVLLTVICATASYSLLHAPIVHAIVETSTRIEEVKLSVQNAPYIREQHARVTSKLADVERRIADVHSRVPESADAGGFLKEVTRIASEERLALKDFQPEKPASRVGYAEMQVSLKGQGSFVSICTFMERLNQLNRLSKVKDLTITAGDWTTEYPMTATLIIYFGISDTSPAEAEEVSRG